MYLRNSKGGRWDIEIKKESKLGAGAAEFSRREDECEEDG